MPWLTKQGKKCAGPLLPAATGSTKATSTRLGPAQPYNVVCLNIVKKDENINWQKINLGGGPGERRSPALPHNPPPNPRHEGVDGGEVGG